MNIREITAKFAQDEDCLKYLQEMRWPDGVIRCPECGDPVNVSEESLGRLTMEVLGRW